MKTFSNYINEKLIINKDFKKASYDKDELNKILKRKYLEKDNKNYKTYEFDGSDLFEIFWSFIEKHGTKSTSHSFEKMQSARNRYTIKYNNTCLAILQIKKDSSKHLTITIINKDKFISVFFSSLTNSSYTWFEIYKNTINEKGLQLFNDEYDYICYEFDTDLVDEIYDFLK